MRPLVIDWLTQEGLLKEECYGEDEVTEEVVSNIVGDAFGRRWCPEDLSLARCSLVAASGLKTHRLDWQSKRFGTPGRINPLLTKMTLRHFQYHSLSNP
jgi:hypothetical protein